MSDAKGKPEDAGRKIVPPQGGSGTAPARGNVQVEQTGHTLNGFPVVVNPNAPGHVLTFGPPLTKGQAAKIVAPRDDLYERCPVCNGTRKTTGVVMCDGVTLVNRPDGKEGGKYTGPLAAQSECPVCADGYVKTGLGHRQVERMRAERDTLLCHLVATLNGLRELNEGNATAEQWEFAGRVILAEAADAISSVNPSSVDAARFKVDQMKREAELRNEKTPDVSGVELGENGAG